MFCRRVVSALPCMPCSEGGRKGGGGGRHTCAITRQKQVRAEEGAARRRNLWARRGRDVREHAFTWYNWPWPEAERNQCRECAYLWSMWKLDDKSAARLEVGDEPRVEGRIVK